MLRIQALLLAVAIASAYLNVVRKSDNADDERIRTCCQAQNARPECMNVCKSNVTRHDLVRAFGRGCFDQLKILLYCSSEGKDGTKCCQSNSVPEFCNVFCRGVMPPLCASGKYSLRNSLKCADNLKTIMTCHRNNLSQTPSWVPNYDFPPPLACEP